MPSSPGQSRACAFELRKIELALGIVGDDAIGHALVADQIGECACVDTGQPDDAARFEPLVEMTTRAIVGRLGYGGLDDAAPDARGGGEVDRLDVVLIGADIADMREGEGDDLAGIGGIGEDLLIAGHRGIEADFAHRLAFGTESLAFDDQTVGQEPEAPVVRGTSQSENVLRPADLAARDRAILAGALVVLMGWAPWRRTHMGQGRGRQGCAATQQRVLAALLHI